MIPHQWLWRWGQYGDCSVAEDSSAESPKWDQFQFSMSFISFIEMSFTLSIGMFFLFGAHCSIHIECSPICMSSDSNQNRLAVNQLLTAIRMGCGWIYGVLYMVRFLSESTKIMGVNVYAVWQCGHMHGLLGLYWLSRHPWGPEQSTTVPD